MAPPAPGEMLVTESRLPADQPTVWMRYRLDHPGEVAALDHLAANQAHATQRLFHRPPDLTDLWGHAYSQSGSCSVTNWPHSGQQ